MRRILIVDDHEGHRAFLCKLLEAHGYRCEAARDGLEALEKLQLTEVDVVLTDLEMPRMNGLNLAQYLARRPRGALPTILLTSWPTEEIRDRARQAGVQATFGKPYEFQQVLEAIERAVGSEERNASLGDQEAARGPRLRSGTRSALEQANGDTGLLR